MIIELIGSICNEIGYFLATTIIGIPVLYLLNRIQKFNQVTCISLCIIKWLFIISSILLIFYWIMFFFDVGQGYIAEQIAFYSRAFQSYMYPYLIFQLAHIIVPFFLFVPSLGRSFIFVFIVSFILHFGLYIQSWLIILTTQLNDFLTPYWMNNHRFFADILLWIMQGFVYLLILLIISRFILYVKVKRQSKYK